ncbi:MAG: hypothetical protein JJ957_07185 [Pseudomonadales bacterium]|nr:hypothetical protein [Pseudomonadales bacterium]
MTYLLALLLTLPLYALAEETVAPATVEDKISKALSDERRTEKDTERDANRQPLKTLEFFRLTDDMTVLELLPGGGWYTKILGPVLEDKGKL